MAEAAKNFKYGSRVEHYDAKTRKEALKSVVTGESTTASHDHAVSPLVHSAASQIISRQRTLDLELYGLPHEVLEEAAEKLNLAGIEANLAQRALNGLGEYILNMGADFTREAKAKPLYARFKVTNNAPEDLPDCEQSQATFLDGRKSYGGDSAQVIRYMSIFGPKSTSSQGVDIDAMFASKQTGLFVFFGSPSNEAVKGFDSIDAGMMNAMQGVGAAASLEQMAELKGLVENEELSAQTLSLLSDLAELAQLKEIAIDPTLQAGVKGEISTLTQEISEQIVLAVEQDAMPQSIVSAAVDALVDAPIDSSLDVSVESNVVASNINATQESEMTDIVAESETAALIEQLSELSSVEGVNAETISTIESQITTLENGVIEQNVDTATIINDAKLELSNIASQEGLPSEAYAAISEILPTLSDVNTIAIPADNMMPNETLDAVASASDVDASSDITQSTVSPIEGNDEAVIAADISESAEIAGVLSSDVQESSPQAHDTVSSADITTAADSSLSSLEIPSAVKAEVSQALDSGDIVALAALAADHPQLETVLSEVSITEGLQTEVSNVVAEVPTSLEAPVNAVNSEVPSIAQEFSNSKVDGVVVEAAAIFTSVAENNDGIANTALANSAQIIDLAAHRELPQSDVGKELSEQDVSVSSQAVGIDARADFGKAAPPKEQIVTPVKLEKGIDLTTPTNNYEPPATEADVVTSPEISVCKCGGIGTCSCGESAAGPAQEVDLTTPTNNYEPPATEADVATSPEISVCKCGGIGTCSCGESAAGPAQEVDLTVSNDIELDTKESTPETKSNDLDASKPKRNFMKLGFS